jgi:hypothetical protein
MGLRWVSYLEDKVALVLHSLEAEEEMLQELFIIATLFK